MKRCACEGPHKPTHIHLAVTVLNSAIEHTRLHLESQLVHHQKGVTLFYGRSNYRIDHSLGAHVANSDQNFDHRIMRLRHIDWFAIRCPRHQRFQHLHPRHHFRVRLRQGLLRLRRPHLQTCQISFHLS